MDQVDLPASVLALKPFSSFILFATLSHQNVSLPFQFLKIVYIEFSFQIYAVSPAALSSRLQKLNALSYPSFGEDLLYYSCYLFSSS